MTQREYTWLDDLPVAVVDAGATLPVIYCVHTDHLFRAVAMTDAGQNIAWGANSTMGRYLPPDPLIVDDGAASVKGLPTILTETTSSVGNGAPIAGTMGIPRAYARALLPDGPRVYDYARQSTIASVKNCARMSRLRAPMAIRRPISWVRSVTADRGTAKIDPKMKADRVYSGSGVRWMREAFAALIFCARLCSPGPGLCIGTNTCVD